MDQVRNTISVDHAFSRKLYSILGIMPRSLEQFTLIMKRRIFITLALLMTNCLGNAMAAEIYVSPTGSDANAGTKVRPLQSLAAAQAAARRARVKKPAQAVTVLLGGGVYYLPETLVFTAQDSGTAKAPVTYAAQPGANAVLSGGMRLQLKWEPYKDGIMQAPVPAGFTTDQLFVNGAQQPMARYPNFDPAQHIFNGYAGDAISPERVKRWADPQGGFIHAMHGSLWGDMSYVITGKNEKGDLTYEGGWQNNRPAAMHPEYRFVENIFEELDAPGEWFLDTKKNILFYYPPAGLDLNRAVMEGVRLQHLVEFQGDERQPVRFVTLRGLTFHHAAQTFMDTREPLLRTDWAIYRSGAIFYNGAEDCALEDCSLDQLGGNAVFVSDYNRRITMRGCHIDRTGASGVAFVGDPKAVRNGITWKDQNDFNTIDKTPGPLGDNYPADCLVEDCLIHETGRTEKQSAGVEIDMARNITVRHCSVYDVPRAGINIGDGAWGGHLIEDCDVFDTVEETGDHGSFNSRGRDRFWNLRNVDLNTVSLGANKDLPLLDMVQPNTLRHNRWRCDHGWDIDLDDGSSNYIIQDNLCLNGGLKNREGFYRLVENNVIVDNSFHPHVWFTHSDDVFRKNIVFTLYKLIGVNKPWGKEVDFNFWHQPGAAVQPAAGLQEQSGRDEHSVIGDVRFVDASRGDYRVRPASPALALGFVNFRMDNFGVQKPSLRAIARTPELPGAVKSAAGTPSLRDPTLVPWLGAAIKNVTGLGEVSAAGLSGEIGVWVQSVAPGSRAARAGLRANDVILKVNDHPTDTLAEFMKIWNTAAPSTKVKLDIWREQKLTILQVDAD